MYENDTFESINIYSQIFIDADELGNAADIFIPVPDLESTSEIDI